MSVMGEKATIESQLESAVMRMSEEVVKRSS
jgi:hypothetical protein